jgi:hypothetical protein
LDLAQADGDESFEGSTQRFIPESISADPELDERRLRLEWSFQLLERFSVTIQLSPNGFFRIVRIYTEEWRLSGMPRPVLRALA